MSALMAKGGRGVKARLARLLRDYSTQSAHFATSAVGPHGMIGTVEVEFFGEPSISLSE